MKKHTRASQVKTINHIKGQLGAYTRWKLCGTKAVFFTKSEIENHLWNLQLINTLTNEPKIAKKAGQLMRLLATVLKKEYQKDPPVTIPQHRYIIKDGSTRISKGAKVPTRGPVAVSPKDGATKEKVPKFL
jgi:hypothetical protein